MRSIGLDVLIAGTVSGDEPARRSDGGPAPIIRLAPRGLLVRARTRANMTAWRPQPVPDPSLPQALPAPEPGRTRTGPLARLNRLTTTLDYYRQGIGLVRAARPALVHCNDYNTVWIGIAAKALCGAIVIYDSHELWPDRNNRPESRPWLIACEALFVRAADRVITASPGYAAAMAQRYRIPAPAVIRNIPVGGAADTVGDSSPSHSLNAPVAAYVGGLMPGRGLEEAIAATALVANMRLWLTGPGRPAYVDALRRLAVREGVAERVEFRPPVGPDEVVASLRGADVGLALIQPICRSYALTLPNKLFEYARAEIPLLATRLPVIAQVVQEHGIGLLAEPGDPHSVAAGLRHILVPETHARLKMAIRAFAADNTWQRESLALAALYREVMDEPSSRWPAPPRSPSDTTSLGPASHRRPYSVQADCFRITDLQFSGGDKAGRR